MDISKINKNVKLVILLAKHVKMLLKIVLNVLIICILNMELYLQQIVIHKFLVLMLVKKGTLLYNQLLILNTVNNAILIVNLVLGLVIKNVLSVRKILNL